jgi:putative ABC transport system permease protein
MVGSFRTTLSSWLVKRLHGDIFISVDLSGEKGAESKISDELLERVKHTTGVGEIRNYRELASDYHGSPALLGATQVASLLRVNAYDLVRVVKHPTGFSPLEHALVSESGARKLGVELGGELYVDKKTAQISSIPSQAEDTRVKVTVYAVIREFGTEQPLFVIDEALFARMFPDHGSENMTMLAATDRTGIQPQQLKKILSEKLPGSLVVRDQNELRELALGMFDKTFLITGAVRWIVFSLALVGVLLSVAQRLWENREDYKLLRILGFSRLAVARVVTVQMLPNVLGSICAGLLTGVLAGWALIALVNPTSFGWTLTFHLTIEPFIVAGLFLVVTLMTMSVMALVVTRAVIDPLPISKE